MFRALALHQSKICCLTLKYNWRRSESGLMTYIMWQINHFSSSVKVGKDSPGFYAFKFWVQLGICLLWDQNFIFNNRLNRPQAIDFCSVRDLFNVNICVRFSIPLYSSLFVCTPLGYNKWLFRSFYDPMYMCKAINDKMFCYACSYLPLLKEETISSQDASFLPNEARKTLFKGKTFIFISKKQVIYIWIWLPKWSHFVFRFCCVFLWLLPPVGWQNHIKYVVKISERV